MGLYDHVVGNVKDRVATVKSSVNLLVGSSAVDAALNQASGFGQNNRSLVGLAGKRLL